MRRASYLAAAAGLLVLLAATGLIEPSAADELQVIEPFTPVRVSSAMQLKSFLPSDAI